MGETVKAFFTRSCTTASSNKTEKSQENKKKKKQWEEGRKSFKGIAVTITGLERSDLRLEVATDNNGRSFDSHLATYGGRLLEI